MFGRKRAPSSTSLSSRGRACLSYRSHSADPSWETGQQVAQSLGAVLALLARHPRLVLMLAIVREPLSEWAQLLRDLRGGLDHVSRSAQPAGCFMSNRCAGGACGDDHLQRGGPPRRRPRPLS